MPSKSMGQHHPQSTILQKYNRKQHSQHFPEHKNKSSSSNFIITNPTSHKTDSPTNWYKTTWHRHLKSRNTLHQIKLCNVAIPCESPNTNNHAPWTLEKRCIPTLPSPTSPRIRRRTFKRDDVHAHNVPQHPRQPSTSSYLTNQASSQDILTLNQMARLRKSTRFHGSNVIKIPQTDNIIILDHTNTQLRSYLQTDKALQWRERRSHNFPKENVNRI
jgi:hypothetical protein